MPHARDHFVHFVAGKLPAFAGLGALRDLDLQARRSSPGNSWSRRIGPDATCLTALRRQSPLGSRSKRASSSPPSPVFERPPIRFIAIASVSCASLLIDPNDIAPVAKRLTISLAGSTSSIGSGLRCRASVPSARAACTNRDSVGRSDPCIPGTFRSVRCAPRAAASKRSTDSADDTRRSTRY